MRESSGLYGLGALVFTFLLAGAPRAATPSESFAQELAAARGAQSTVSGILLLDRQLDIDQIEREIAERHLLTRAARHQFVLSRARELAAETQPAVLAALNRQRAAGSVSEVHSFWITNAIAVDATPAGWDQILSIPGVGAVNPNAEVTMRIGDIAPGSVVPPPVTHGKTNGARGSALLGGGGDPPIPHEDGLVCVNVSAAWNRGLTGSGRLICSFDTGADGTHPAFASRWRGLDVGVPWNWAWRDPYYTSQFPYDPHFHGIGVLGVMCAAPPDTTPIGVAYEAEWIAALTCCTQYNVQKIIDNYQWAADPDSNLATIEDVPDVINNSWGTTQDCDQTYWNAIDVVEAAGIVNVISVDNSGPSPASVNSPESRATTPYRNFGVGNVDPHTSGYPIWASSGRGPSPCDFFSIKPEMTAPGVLIRMPYPGGSYAMGVGTSFAAPHVSGAVAILRQLNPNLSVDQIKEALMVSAFDRGAAGEDNTYGWGVLDIGAAIQYVETTFPWAPAPHKLVAQVVFSHDVLLNWTPPTVVFQQNPLTAFRVYRAMELDAYPDTALVELPTFPASFTDTGLADGIYHYRVTAVFQDGTESAPSNEVTEAIDSQVDVADGAGLPPSLELRVRPNPIRGAADLLLATPSSRTLSLAIYDASGKRLRRLLDQSPAAPGRRAIRWDAKDDAGRDLPSGIYFATLSDGERQSRQRLIVLR